MPDQTDTQTILAQYADGPSLLDSALSGLRETDLDLAPGAVTVLVGVAAEHWRRGLGKAVMTEALRRLKALGCTRVFSTAHEEPADALYRSALKEMKVTDTWLKEL